MDSPITQVNMFKVFPVDMYSRKLYTSPANVNCEFNISSNASGASLPKLNSESIVSNNRPIVYLSLEIDGWQYRNIYHRASA